MKKLLGFLLVVALFFGAVTIANGVMIGFDDILGNAEITNQYASDGIIFQQTIALKDWRKTDIPSKHPGDHIAVSGAYESSIFLFDYVIDSFSLLVASYDRTLCLEAYDDSDNLLGFTSQLIPKGKWYSMGIELTGLSAQKIVIHDSMGFYAFDEIVFSAIPEPCTFLLFCIGIIGFIGIKRKIRN